jgi:hypothetical protein
MYGKGDGIDILPPLQTKRDLPYYEKLDIMPPLQRERDMPYHEKHQEVLHGERLTDILEWWSTGMDTGIEELQNLVRGSPVFENEAMEEAMEERRAAQTTTATTITTTTTHRRPSMPKWVNDHFGRKPQPQTQTDGETSTSTSPRQSQDEPAHHRRFSFHKMMRPNEEQKEVGGEASASGKHAEAEHRERARRGSNDSCRPHHKKQNTGLSMKGNVELMIWS